MIRSITITNRHPRLRLDRRAIAAAVGLLDAHATKFLGGCPPGELSLVFLTDSALAKIHADFMDDPTATDVITFAGGPATLGCAALAKEAGFAGEICVSVDTARAYARARRRDFSAELTLYLVHGWLHLAGYDDRRPAMKRRMRAAEARAMKLLRKAKAVPEFRLA